MSARRNDLLHLLRANLWPLQGSGLVAHKSSECFSVRHVPDGVRGGHGDADRALVGGKSYQRFEEMEHRAADSRRRSAGAYRETRHADDGWFAGHRFSHHLDPFMGAAVTLLCFDHYYRDPRVWSCRFLRRLSIAAEAEQTRTNCTP